MKKIVLSIATILVFGFANAQEKKTASLDTHFGLKGGLNLANVTNSDGGSSLASFHVGAFAEIPISDKLYLQPELVYSGQGVKFDEISFHLNYLNIPVMFKYYVSNEFSIEAGPQLGIMVSAKVTDGDTSVDIKDTFNTTDASFNFGIGYSVSDNMAIGLRYDLGLTDLIKKQYLEPGESNSKNSVFQLSLSYRF